MNLWPKLKKIKIEESRKGGKPVEPILVLAPMADVTDAAFREVINKCGKPDVFWTEFVSADGLVLAPDNNPDEFGVTSQDKLRSNLKFNPDEKPIVAQIFGSNAKNIKKAARIIRKMGFDGVDINMGCPDRAIEKQGCGSAMIKNPTKAHEIIWATKNGVGFQFSIWTCLYYIFNTLKTVPDRLLGYNQNPISMFWQAFINSFAHKLKTKISVSVKTRLGYNQDVLENWLPKILVAYPELITIHARTRKQMSKASANWDRIKRAVEIRDEWYENNFWRKKIDPNQRTLIFGNGDVKNLNEALQKSFETKCDGVMVGRGIFGNPWFFNKKMKINGGDQEITLELKFQILLEQIIAFERELPHRNFAVMKKHFKAYINDFSGAKELREKLMKCDNSEEIKKNLDNFLNVGII